MIICNGIYKERGNTNRCIHISTIMSDYYFIKNKSFFILIGDINVM